MSRTVSTTCLAIAALACCAAAPPSKPFVDCDAAELVRAVPELAGIQPDPNQDRLDALLRATGDSLAKMLAKFGDTTATEEIHEMRFESGMTEASRRDNFLYRARPLPNSEPVQLEEFRLDPATKALVQPPANSGFLVFGHFISMMNYLLPDYRDQARFRYVGRLTAAGQDAFIVAFAPQPDAIMLRKYIPGPLEGLAWIDAASHRILRLRLDLLAPAEDSPLTSFTATISLAAVDDLWVPSRATVHARFAAGELHSVHRFSGRAAAPADTGEDAWELLDRGIALTQENKPAEALPVLREALRMIPDNPAAHFHLGNALRLTGDGAAAETELRATLKGAPDSEPAHNLMGMLLFKSGDLPAATAEFRRCIELDAKDPVAHFNLAESLHKQGDTKAALDEYRAASALAPDNAKLKARLEQVANAPAPPPAPTTFKVEVRQVLVPVVVTDKEGHHVTGLTQADFKIFEDGVEQKITAFSVESAGSPAPVSAPAPVSEAAPALSPTAPAKAAPVPPRRTYLICIDALHGAFENLVHVREALTKLFQSEQAGDARYAVVTVGNSIQVVQDNTSDPAAVLQALEDKRFQRTYLSSAKAGMQAEMAVFRSNLNDIRLACDAQQPDCVRKASLPAQAHAFAEHERQNTVVFLDNLRALVRTLSGDAGRRTMVLISDGFGLIPGREAYQLLEVYFPEFGSLEAVDRMTDMEPVMRLAANNNVPIYTIDSRGLYTDSFFSAANPGGISRMLPAIQRAMSANALDEGQTLSEIAAATGGTAFHNSNDILGGLERAFADGRAYYLLAYVPSHATAGARFRAISIQLRNSKLVVNAKKGYWSE